MIKKSLLRLSRTTNIMSLSCLNNYNKLLNVQYANFTERNNLNMDMNKDCSLNDPSDFNNRTNISSITQNLMNNQHPMTKNHNILKSEKKDNETN